MNFRKLLLVFGFLFVLNPGQFLKAQIADNCIAIAINEYCAANTPGNGLPDAFGELSDWVELKCNFTSQVSLAGYYLSNDRTNLFKWKFPSDFLMGSGSLKLVWLSGRNTTKANSLGSKEYHANFTIDQCKSQWIILSTSTGVIRDSVFVQPAQGGHSWGRIDCYTTGMAAFRLFKADAKSPLAENSTINFDGYAPMAKLVVSTETDFISKPNKGGFYPETQLAYFKMHGRTYDTATTCYDIFYTEDGSYPIPGYPPTNATKRYNDSLTPITISKTEVIRFITVPRPASENIGCAGFNRILPSFCESNTYFIDPSNQLISADFGVISVTLNDPFWLTPNGGVGSTSIHVEYYDKQKQVSEGYAQIDKPFFESWRTKQLGFNISIDDRFGFGCNFEGTIFNVDGLGTSTRSVFPTLHLNGADFESHSERLGAGDNVSFGTGLRDVLMQSLAAKNNLHVNALHIKPVIAFFNGEYKGVYNLKEVFDKYYENFYNGQPMDSLDLNYVHLTEGNVKYWDGSFSSTPFNTFRTDVYDVVMGFPMNGANNTKYKKVLEKLDKASFIDYMILNSFAQNQDLFKFNVGFARGHDATKRGYKWHYYLLNMPASFNFTAVTNPGITPYTNFGSSPCYIHTGITAVQSGAYDGHGNMLTLLMGNAPSPRATWGNDGFKLEYRNRYQDLVNGPLKCENLQKHYEYLVELYRKEMSCHEDPGCEPTSAFGTQIGLWDTNTTILRRVINGRCYSIQEQFGKGNCYGLKGPFNLSVDVRPQVAGFVKVNTTVLNSYKWTGKYYQTTMSFKAIPTSTAYSFHHWEISGPTGGPMTTDPLSMDSIGMNFNVDGDLVAVFTDKRNDIIGEGVDANVPTGFTPNGDGINDVFRPLGTAEYATEYQMTIWNRWGQEVFRSVSPFEGWDGSYHGSEAITGVYAYVITYKNIYGESKLVKGNVTLTR